MIEGLNNLMVCIDGSQESIIAAKKAVEIATIYGSKIIALNIIFIHSSIRRVPDYYLKELYDFNLEQMNTWLEDIIADAKIKKIKLSIKIKETTSSIVDEILKIEDDENIDLIILGGSRKSKVDRALLGSVAQGISTNSKCSVLVVR